MTQLLTLGLANFSDAEHIGRMSATFIEHGLPHSWTTQRIRGAMRHRGSVVLAAKREVELLGFAIMEFGDIHAHLNLLAVDSRIRRRGIGRQMLLWLHESAMTAGTFIIRLELRAKNLDARRFYESMGYEECGYLPNYYSGMEDALQMRRDLTVRAA